MTVIAASWKTGRQRQRTPARSSANGNSDGKSRPGIEQAMQERWRMSASKADKKVGGVKPVKDWLAALGCTVEQYKGFRAFLAEHGIDVEVEHDRSMSARKRFTLSAIDSIGFDEHGERAVVLRWTFTELELPQYLSHPNAVLLEFERMRAANADMTDDERRELDWQVLR
jgi:hypothetical protein